MHVPSESGGSDRAALACCGQETYCEAAVQVAIRDDSDYPDVPDLVEALRAVNAPIRGEAAAAHLEAFQDEGDPEDLPCALAVADHPDEPADRLDVLEEVLPDGLAVVQQDALEEVLQDVLAEVH